MDEKNDFTKFSKNTKNIEILEKLERLEIQNIVKKAKSGDVSAFQLLVNKYEKKIFNTAYWFLRNKDDAFDITQEVFIEAFKNLKKFREESSFFTWINWILLDRVKRKRIKDKIYNTYIKPLFKRDKDDMDEDYENLNVNTTDTDNPIHILAKKEKNDFILKKINSLDEKYSMPVILCDLENMSYKEAAEILNCPESTIKIRLFRARLQLKDLLKNLKN